jgi:hypothetical protein
MHPDAPGGSANDLVVDLAGLGEHEQGRRREEWDPVSAQNVIYQCDLPLRSYL